MNKQIPILTLYGILLSTLCLCGRAPVVRLENHNFIYSIGIDGKNRGFIDRTTGTDYLDAGKDSYCARIVKDGTGYNATSVSREGNKLILQFSEAGISVALDIITRNDYIVLDVASVEGGGIESLVFVDIPLTLEGMPDEPFAACAFALNLPTHVPQLPALQSHLQAACYERFKLEGARAAVIGVPLKGMRSALKDVTLNFSELPHSTAGGAWALDSPAAQGSYLMNFGTLTEETVDEWIAMVKNLGFNQISSHGGRKFFRFGDFELAKDKWPQGWENFKNINRKLHEAGIQSILLTYSCFIDVDTKYITPVPHPQLASFRTFTLAKPIAGDAAEIEVVESTADISTITGFFVRNSRTLHIGDELITFIDVTRETPYKFLGCQRAQYNTKAAPHAKGAKAKHLKMIFNRFVPDPDSELFGEIAMKQAEIVNYCDFDGINFDAIDGADILGGKETFWYYGGKTVIEVAKHLKKPVNMEMCAMTHHWWQYCSNWQAWDRPVRGYKRFVDIKLASIKMHELDHGIWSGYKPHIDRFAGAPDGAMMLPFHLGWWGNHAWDPPQAEPTFADDTEYLACKMIANNAGLSMLGDADSETLKKYPGYARNIDLIRQYEDLRHNNYFPDHVKQELRQPEQEFTLFRDVDDRWKFRRVHYGGHKVEGINHHTSSWHAANPFQNQPLRFRLEVLMSAKPYDDPESVTIADFNDESEFPEKVNAGGVINNLIISSDEIKAGGTSALFTAKNSGKVKRDAGWSKAGKTFNPLLNLEKQQGLGVWIRGDGQGELLNLRLESPDHLSYGAKGEHYIPIDFEGWRYFELIEIGSTVHSNFVWPDSGFNIYDLHRHYLRFTDIDRFSLWYNNLPEGKEVKCHISPVKALPLISITIKNPKITVDDKTLIFPVEMESGSYLEFNSMSDCRLYGPQGELRGTVTPIGEVPVLKKGPQEISFTCDQEGPYNTRAKVTVISYGEVVE